MNKLRISKTVNVSNLLFCLYQWLRAEMSPQWQIVLLNTVVHFLFNKKKKDLFLNCFISVTRFLVC